MLAPNPSLPSLPVALSVFFVRHIIPSVDTYLYDRNLYDPYLYDRIRSTYLPTKHEPNGPDRPNSPIYTRISTTPYFCHPFRNLPPTIQLLS